jgi:hypothetical protein
VPVNPAGFTAVQTGPGQVQLSWYPVSGVSFYLLLGPGVTQGGEKVVGTTTFTATNVAAGSQQWAVASFYDPGNISTPASAFPRVNLNVAGPVPAPPAAPGPGAPAPPPPAVTPPPPAAPTTPAPSGRYLVSVTGVRAYQMSTDDILSRDGRGDEVYAAAFVRRYDRRTAQLLESPLRKTVVYGDVTNATQRIQGGSASATGGIQDGDMVPGGTLVAVRSTPAQDTTFPWRLWEGTLTNDSDVLIISPSIWEVDGGTAISNLWEQQQQALHLSAFAYQSVQDQIAQKTFGTLVSSAAGLGGNNVLDTQLRGAADIVLFQFGLAAVTLLATSNDRPIGLVATGPDQTVLPNQLVVLTREIIEAALAQPARGQIPSPVATTYNFGSGLLQNNAAARLPVAAPKPGILVIQFEDRNVQGGLGFPERPAIYQMFIQVERLP